VRAEIKVFLEGSVRREGLEATPLVGFHLRLRGKKGGINKFSDGVSHDACMTMGAEVKGLFHKKDLRTQRIPVGVCKTAVGKCTPPDERLGIQGGGSRKKRF